MARTTTTEAKTNVEIIYVFVNELIGVSVSVSGFYLSGVSMDGFGVLGT